MFRFLSKLLGHERSIHKLAASDDVHEFVNALGEMKPIMLGSLTQEGLPFETLTEEAFMAEVERAAEELSKRQSFSPFTYLEAGVTHLPFFTSNEAADVFCGAYCGREKRLFQFQAFVVDARWLANWAAPGVSVIMDPQTDNEFVLSDAQVNALRKTYKPLTDGASIDIPAIPSSARALVVPALPQMMDDGT